MRIHPGAWALWAGCAGFVVISTTDPFYLIPVVAAAFAVSAAHRLDGPWARSFRTFLLFGLVALCARTLLVLLGPVNAGNVAYASLEGLRVAVLLVVFGTFNSVTDPFGLLRLAPRRLHEPALAASLALSIAPRTVMAAARVREAQKLRGIQVSRWRALPALAVPVLETGMEEAVTLAESMDSRGHGSHRRTSYRKEAWGSSASAVAAAGLGAAALFGTALVSGSSLSMQTFPVAWPQVSWTLVLAVLLLGTPAFVPGGRRGR